MRKFGINNSHNISSRSKGLSLTEQDALYVDARWNGLNRTKQWSLGTVGWPSGIARVTTVEQVQAVVNYAREHCYPAGISLAVACGRHSHASMPTNALVLDLSGMNEVKVDAAAKLAVVSGGCLAGDFNDALKPYNLAGVTGDSWNTGVGGQWLHGGHGILEKKMGMVIDNIVETEIVTADGVVKTCNAFENEELFWACRGAGSSFGIVTKITVKLIELPEKSEIVQAMQAHIPTKKGTRAKRLKQMRAFSDKDSTVFTSAERESVTPMMVMPVGGPVV